MDTQTMFMIIGGLVILQPHETNPNYKPRESFEILLRQGLSQSNATKEMLRSAAFVNENI